LFSGIFDAENQSGFVSGKASDFIYHNKENVKYPIEISSIFI